MVCRTTFNPLLLFGYFEIKQPRSQKVRGSVSRHSLSGRLEMDSNLIGLNRCWLKSVPKWTCCHATDLFLCENFFQQFSLPSHLACDQFSDRYRNPALCI